MHVVEFKQRMAHDGWVIFPSMIEPEFIERLRRDMDNAYRICRAMQIERNIAEGEGALHHVVNLGDSFMELLERKLLWEYMEAYFEHTPFILTAFNGGMNFPHVTATYNKIHRDLRTFSGTLPLRLNTLIMIDDFTPENGATWLCTGSHRKDECPDEKTFYATAQQATGPAGSIVLFNTNLWHTGGQNKTDTTRRFLSPCYTKPFMKQLCDYPRLLGYDYADTLSEDMKQILGYNSRVPASLDEWYQPAEKRFYKPGQG